MNTEIKATIERLISEEDSATERARLLVLLQISNVMSDINEKNKQLESKITESQNFINHQRRASDRYAGAKKIIIAVAVASQAVGGYFISQIIDYPKKTTADIVALERRVFMLESSLRIKDNPVPVP